MVETSATYEFYRSVDETKPSGYDLRLRLASANIAIVLGSFLAFSDTREHVGRLMKQRS